MLYYRPISDIHREWDRDFFLRHCKKQMRANPHSFIPYEPSHLDTDKDTILGLAGDIDSKKHTIDFLKKMSTRFKYVVCVLGNHDYWKRDLDSHVENVKKALAEAGCSNVFVLENDSVVIEGYRFIGATLWTDFNKDDLLLNLAKEQINDYKFMRKGNYSRRVRPVDIYKEHEKSAKFIFSFAQNDEKMIVLSHHAPSFKSVDYSRYGMGPINHLYATEFGNQIAYSNFLFWHHGHIHASRWYQIFNTWVICNPRGYFAYQMNKQFDDTKLIELP